MEHSGLISLHQNIVNSKKMSKQHIPVRRHYSLENKLNTFKLTKICKKLKYRYEVHYIFNLKDVIVVSKIGQKLGKCLNTRFPPPIRYDIYEKKHENVSISISTTINK